MYTRGEGFRSQANKTDEIAGSVEYEDVVRAPETPKETAPFFRRQFYKSWYHHQQRLQSVPVKFSLAKCDRTLSSPRIKEAVETEKGRILFIIKGRIWTRLFQV